MALFDFLRRKHRSQQRGVRGGRVPDRRPDQGTVLIGTPAGASPPPAPAAPSPPVHASPPAATVVIPRAASVAPRASSSAGETEYVDVRKMLPNQVVGVLVAIEGDLEGEVYRVFDGENRLGRSPDCEIELPSKKISREHAKLIHRDGMFVIAPLSDKNPTILNDAVTEGAELGDGDTLKLGRTTFRFRSV